MVRCARLPANSVRCVLGQSIWETERAMDIWSWGLIVAAILLVIVGLVAGARRRRRLPPASAPSAPSVVVEPGVATEPTVVVEPEAVAEPAAPTLERPEAAPALERPDPAAGRLVRLRSRLARSNSALGHGLLTLLSRDSLDESTWEEIEDVLDRKSTRLNSSHL